MSYSDIPRYATSLNCSRAQYRKVWKFENADKRNEQRLRWNRDNPAYEAIRRPVSYHAPSKFTGEAMDIGLYSVMQSDQKSPLELLMEKEEACTI